MKNQQEYQCLHQKLDYLQSRARDLSSCDDVVYHQMPFLLEEMDVIRRQMLEIETYDFYSHIGDSHRESLSENQR